MLIGVDIGGTKVAAGVVDEAGKILFSHREPMVSDRGCEEAVECVVRAIQRSLDACAAQGWKIDGIGVSSPGPLDPRAGVVLNPPNLPCWRNYPLVTALSSRFDLPVVLDNDANAAALAEAKWGAGRGHSIVFYATFGTGVGAGLVVDGEIYHGRTGAAIEGGHVSIDRNGPRCGCGKRGCIEALACGPAIARAAQQALPQAAAKSQLHAAVDLRCEDVAAAESAGDELARGVLDSVADDVAVWLGNIIDLLEPEVIVIGGGAGELISRRFELIRSRLPEYCINQRCTEIPLLRAYYAADSGIAGAAALCAAPSFVS